MAKKDTVTKSYMEDRNKFADLVNFYVYNGEKVVKPEKLHPLDTTASALLEDKGKALKTVKAVQKHRDVLKYLSGMADENTAYVIYGLELQSGIHYAMPVRNMLYDALQYTYQVDVIAEKHEGNKDKGENSGEYLSGFHKDDRIIPVVTIVVYFGPDEWDGPQSVYDMFSTKDPHILKYVPDYRMNLVSPSAMSDEDLDKFSTELKQVFKYMKYSSDKEKLRQIINEDDTYKHISRKTAVMINTLSGTKMKIESGKDEVDMCKAIEDMRKEEREKGIEEGLEKGIEKGIEKGREEGRNEGIIETLSGLVNDGLITLETAASRAGMTVKEFETRLGS